MLVGMDDGAGVSAEGGPLAGSCHAFTQHFLCEVGDGDDEGR